MRLPADVPHLPANMAWARSRLLAAEDDAEDPCSLLATVLEWLTTRPGRLDDRLERGCTAGGERSASPKHGVAVSAVVRCDASDWRLFTENCEWLSLAIPRDERRKIDVPAHALGRQLCCTLSKLVRGFEPPSVIRSAASAPAVIGQSAL